MSTRLRCKKARVTSNKGAEWIEMRGRSECEEVAAEDKDRRLVRGARATGVLCKQGEHTGTGGRLSRQGKPAGKPDSEPAARLPLPIYALTRVQRRPPLPAGPLANEVGLSLCRFLSICRQTICRRPFDGSPFAGEAGLPVLFPLPLAPIPPYCYLQPTNPPPLCSFACGCHNAHKEGASRSLIASAYGSLRPQFPPPLCSCRS